MAKVKIGWSGVLCIAAIAGCEGTSNTKFMTKAKLDKGLVVILPGIEGPSPANANIRRGLVRAGVDCAMPIYAWGVPVPGAGLLINQVNFLGNRLAGANIAKFIAEYQDSHPDRPVHVIGHSGGGGVAVFTAENMPDGKKIDGLVLLSASISQGYNLSNALKNLRSGIVNFHNPEDGALLGVGTTVMGNVDGGHGPSAGKDGFTKKFEGLYQKRVHGSGDPHFSATRVSFVSRRVAPWVMSRSWPASMAVLLPGATGQAPVAITRADGVWAPAHREYLSGVRAKLDLWMR